jgi:two-component sensor histidine kinase
VPNDQDNRRGWEFRHWSLSVKVVAALTFALLPLAGLALAVTVSTYRRTIEHAFGVSTLQWVTLATPLLMLLWALVIGWLIADRILVRPLTNMRAAVEHYGRGGARVRLATIDWQSAEMAALALAFDGMAEARARHVVAMDDALEEQRRLTREVHHRVKNNLQIVASLLSLQARDTTDVAVGRAYSAVQARVGALAIVHRWMYDDETARGVDLRALVTDLCAGLEQSTTATIGVSPHISCHVARFFVAQDTAVPLAFLVTELVSIAAAASAPVAAEIKVSAMATAGAATLTIACKAFCDDALVDPKSSAVRIVTGLARQMRAPLRHDAHDCTYTIDFAVPAVSQT